MSSPFYIFFGVLPSIIWLLFYLRKDAHPESNRMILRVFFSGMLIAVPTVFIELGFLEEIEKLSFSPFWLSILKIFVAVALIEELLKYLLVKINVLGHHEFDEPLDTMLYMIIAALGFAASENILIMFSLGPVFLFQNAVSVSIFRFIGATFLHALCSGTFGFFLALSFFEPKHKLKIMTTGMGISILLHGLYNFSIMKMGDLSKFFIPLVILIGSAVFVSLGFKKLKKIKSICKIH